MKLEVTKEKLQDAVHKAEKIAGKNMSLPVLNCIHLEAVDNKLKLKATNLDIGVEIEIPAKISEMGTVTVPATTLNNYITNINDDRNVILEVEKGNLKVGTAKNSTIIKSFPSEDFPIIPYLNDSSDTLSFKINPKIFSKGLKSVAFSASNSNIKPELSSIMIESKDGYLYFVATDSFRLAEKKIQDKGLKEEIGQILIPIKNISEIIRIIENANEDVLVRLNKNQISFHFDSHYLTSRIIDGNFPDYKQLIPKEFKSEAVILKQDFLNAMRVSTVFSDKFNQVAFTISPKNKLFTIESINSDVGENKTKIDAALTGDPIDIKFNHKYLIDSFNPLEADSVSLQLVDKSKPMVIRGVGDTSFTYLVMPMNR
jgi:DNA polymerase III subunit beta